MANGKQKSLLGALAAGLGALVVVPLAKFVWRQVTSTPKKPVSAKKDAKIIDVTSEEVK